MSRSRSASAIAGVLAIAIGAPVANGAGASVTVGDTGTAMSRVSADLLVQALATGGVTGLRVSFDSVAAADAALRTGAIEAYAGQTATLLERVARHAKERDDVRLRNVLDVLLAARGQAVLGIAPYDDAPQVACTRAAVRAHRLSGLLALGRAARRLTYAASPAHVVRADGLTALRVRFRRVVVSPGPRRFDVVARRRAHCVESSGTDPRAARLGLVALRDRTRRLAGTPQHGATVVGSAYLAAAPPEFGQIAARVAALLTVPTVRAARGRVEIDGDDPAVVARDILRENGIIP